MEILDLLKKLDELNQTSESSDLFPQKIEDPVEVLKIPTLEKGVYTNVTPMLKIRFNYASSWSNATAGQSWLSIEEMENSWVDQEIKSQIDVKKEYWEGSAPSKFPLNRLTIFAIDKEEYGETYLIWGQEKEEPTIAYYASQHEMVFENFYFYMRYWVGIDQ